MKLAKKMTAAVILTGLLVGCGSAPSKEKVTEALKPIMPANFAVNSVEKLNVIKDVYEVVVAIDKQPTVLYVDKSLKHVISGSIVEIASKKNLTYETQMKNRNGGVLAVPPVELSQPAEPVKK